MLAWLRNQETEPPGGLSILLLGRVPSLTTWPASTRGIFRGSNDGTVMTLMEILWDGEAGGHPTGGDGGTEGALRCAHYCVHFRDRRTETQKGGVQSPAPQSRAHLGAWASKSSSPNRLLLLAKLEWLGAS